jgi:SSS family solute:Na+ symporter
MATLDWIVLGLFVIGLIGVVFYALKKKDKNTTDYFLAGRDATWIAIGASIFASNIGSEHLVGLAGSGAESGMAMAHWEMHGWMILLLGWLFVPFYARSKVFTMPEFLERRYNPQARSFLSIISLVSYVLTKVAVTVYAGGVVFKDVFDIEYITAFGYNIDFFWISAIGLVVLTGLYTTFGGMKAVLYTSVLQTPILLIGSIAVLVLGLHKIGGWGEMMEIARSADVTYLNDAGEVVYHSTKDSMANLIRSHNDPEFPWTGVILGSAIIGFWYWCTDQFIVQRVLSGRDMKQARRGTIFGAYLKLTPVFIFLIPGMIAYGLQQKGLIVLENNDAAFSTMVKELLPIGFKGIVIGGILAALMSSLASLFNSSAMLFTVDFYQKYKPNKDERHYVIVGRIATVVVVLLGIAWIPVMRGLGKVLYEYLQDVQSLLAPGIAAVFLLGVVSKRTTPAAGIWGLIIGFTLGMTRLGLNIFSGSISEDSLIYLIFLQHNWLHYEIYLFFLVIIAMVVISYFTKKKDPSLIQGLTIRSASAEQTAETRLSYNNWDIFNSIVIIVIIVLFYAYFW